ncbi:hypothetical protein Bpfe_002999 [Biomphalaria pfeifferi]|uniref:Uncharacterized protein n=1 Tax=Biomphalaria pfeifferi TaxID=112525 RepID=A0AAD8C7N5_BIOPF|nr:hypothetical protein Bpfe_002999 [Biomphalaria pfeifferi]
MASRRPLICPHLISGRCVVFFLVASLDGAGNGVHIADMAKQLCLVYFSQVDRKRHYDAMVICISEICERLLAYRRIHKIGQRFFVSPIRDRHQERSSGRRNNIRNDHHYSGFDFSSLIGRSVLMLLMKTIGGGNGLTTKDLLMQLKNVLDTHLGFFL